MPPSRRSAPVVLDLAAGTGKLTGPLLAAGWRSSPSNRCRACWPNSRRQFPVAPCWRTAETSRWRTPPSMRSWSARRFTGSTPSGRSPRSPGSCGRVARWHCCGITTTRPIRWSAAIDAALTGSAGRTGGHRGAPVVRDRGAAKPTPPPPFHGHPAFTDPRGWSGSVAAPPDRRRPDRPAAPTPTSSAPIRETRDDAGRCHPGRIARRSHQARRLVHPGDLRGLAVDMSLTSTEHTVDVARDQRPVLPRPGGRRRPRHAERVTGLTLAHAARAGAAVPTRWRTSCSPTTRCDLGNCGAGHPGAACWPLA